MSEQPETAGPMGKILTGETGVGTVTPEMVEQRARELARMDGRNEPHDLDRQQAQAELLGPAEAGDGPEAVNEELERITSWDEAPESTGVRAALVRPEDDANIAETLVQEGMEEAEHDQRLSAADENPPDEEG